MHIRCSHVHVVVSVGCRIMCSRWSIFGNHCIAFFTICSWPRVISRHMIWWLSNLFRLGSEGQLHMFRHLLGFEFVEDSVLFIYSEMWFGLPDYSCLLDLVASCEGFIRGFVCDFDLQIWAFGIMIISVLAMLFTHRISWMHSFVAQSFAKSNRTTSMLETMELVLVD